MKWNREWLDNITKPLVEGFSSSNENVNALRLASLWWLGLLLLLILKCASWNKCESEERGGRCAEEKPSWMNRAKHGGEWCHFESGMDSLPVCVQTLHTTLLWSRRPFPSCPSAFFILRLFACFAMSDAFSLLFLLLSVFLLADQLTWRRPPYIHRDRDRDRQAEKWGRQPTASRKHADERFCFSLPSSIPQLSTTL